LVPEGTGENVMQRCPVAVSLAFGLVVGVPAVAGAERLVLDPADTTVSFQLPATGHDVHGVFALDHGEVVFDPATGAAQGEISVTATGAETGNKKRDKAMHGKVLESATYPLFVFRPQRVEGALPATGSAEIKIHGTLTLHGQDHPLTLPATVERDGDRLHATTTFSVPYVEWGLHDPSFLFFRVAKVVDVTISADGRLSDAAADASADVSAARAAH
jgi:polyisoprenoid-binding protein YceI